MTYATLMVQFEVGRSNAGLLQAHFWQDHSGRSGIMTVARQNQIY
jgi:hypothetical protein